ncbi:MAG: uracil-DNA glycosylase [Betaproteobacteria bacterium]|nr:uracil-DNA glycosylase [Betaproteobacteria bacterium]
MGVDVNWAAYTSEQLHELELSTLASWSGDLPVDAPASLEARPPGRPIAIPVVPKTAQVPSSTPAVTPAPARALGQADWTLLREQAAACTACQLHKRRNRSVFGVGSESGPWMFIGEGPGMEEDQEGEPFVGQAGKLLDAMLASIQLSRKTNVYIANVVKCRPPGNRTPLHEEAAACADFLDRQIDLVNPKLIVALGKTAATRLTGQEASLASQRGKRFDYRGFPVLITYHPAYLLRNLPDKAKAWEDLLEAKRIFAEVG